MSIWEALSEARGSGITFREGTLRRSGRRAGPVSWVVMMPDYGFASQKGPSLKPTSNAAPLVRLPDLQPLLDTDAASLTGRAVVSAVGHGVRSCGAGPDVGGFLSPGPVPKTRSAWRWQSSRVQ